MGNVGQDPEVKYLDGNKVVATFTLATNETYKDRNNERQKITDWHNIEMWDELAKLAEKYVRKGKLLLIEGKLKTDKWNDKTSGEPRSRIVVRANSMNFINTGQGQQQGQPASSAPTESASMAAEPDDDLPF